MSDLPPGLENFGERLEKAAERDIEQRRAPRRRMRSIGLPVTAALLAAAVSAGAVRLADGDREGAPIEPERGGGAADLQPAKDPAVIEESAVEDPHGGAPWVVRAYTNAAGRACVQAGQLRDGQLVQRQRGRYRALPSSAAGQCAAQDAGGVVIASRRAGDLTLVFGVGVDEQPVTVRVGDRARTVRPLGFGAFLDVVAGAGAKPRVEVRSQVGGRTMVRRFG